MDKRKKLLVDSKVQGALLFRLVWYAGLCGLLMTSQILVWRMIAGPTQPLYVHFSEMWALYAPTILAAGTLLPIIAWDMLRLSHRFVGPMLRLRNEMRRLANGEKVRPIHLRNDDFWHESADAFNAVLERMQRTSGSSFQPTQDLTATTPEPEPAESATH